MCRSLWARPSGLAGSHQPFTQAVNELLVGLRQIGEKAVDRFHDYAPLRETGDRAERIQPCLELEWHPNAQLRVVLYLFSFFRTSRRPAGATTITDALFGHSRQCWRPHG